MKISFSALPSISKLPAADTLIFAVGEDGKFPSLLAAADKKTGGQITRAVKSSKFKGKLKQALTVSAPTSIKADRIVLLGVGKLKDADAVTFQNVGGSIVVPANAEGAKIAEFVMEIPGGKNALKISLADAAANVAYGAQLKSYHFDKYKTKEKPEDKPSLKQLSVATADNTAANKQYKLLEKIGDGVFTARDLVTEPSNVLYPETLAEACKELTKLGVDVKVLGEKEMQKLGMNALLGVGQGSAKESKLVVMQWKGAGTAKGKSAAPLAFVGKGVTFDTGGISIKPSGGMEEMKQDMGGSAAVIGVIKALAGRKAKVNAVGVVGTVENMPDGNAQRPGDVVKSMSGQTIEVLNTDAEGRLVLADALWYTQEKFKPKFVINLATLTGAIIVALGTSRAGIFSNDDKLSEQLADAGVKSGEDVWRLPLGEIYDKQIDSEIADMQNIGADREAGSITAAQFLQRFIQKGTPWAHIDIAGVAWTKKGLDTCPKGATGYGVRLLNQLVADHYEK